MGEGWGKVGEMHTVLTQKAELPIERWLGFLVGRMEGMMAIKILIKRKIKNGNMRAASRLVINNRNGAMKQSGYISSESWRGLDDTDHVVVVSMWEN